MQDPLQERLEFVGLDEEARAALDALACRLDAHADAALGVLQARTARLPSSVRFLYGRDQLDISQNRQAEQLRRVLTGHTDMAGEASMRLGQRHARLKLEPRWHIGAYGVMVEALFRGVVRDVLADAIKPKKGRLGFSAPRNPAAVLADADAMARGLSAVVKTVLVDIDLTVSAHLKKIGDDARLQEEQVRGRMRQAAQETGRTLRLVADGQWQQGADTSGEPEFEAVRDSANIIAERLALVLGQLQAASGKLRTATGEIHASAGDMADRTLQQAVGIEQANAMVLQLATTLSENARKMSAASKKAKGLAQGAALGEETLTHAEATLAGIRGADREVEGAIEGMDDVAFALNLLALRAATEASNAGKGGGGMAEIAAELKQQAQGLTKRLKVARRLVEDRDQRMAEGEQSLARSREALMSLSANAGESAQLVDGAAKAGKNQCDALEQVTLVLRQMDEMTQHGAVLGEQTRVALELAVEQIQALEVLLDVFRSAPAAAGEALSA